jgi:hypothetical protein
VNAKPKRTHSGVQLNHDHGALGAELLISPIVDRVCWVGKPCHQLVGHAGSAKFLKPPNKGPFSNHVLPEWPQLLQQDAACLFRRLVDRIIK